MLHKKGERGQTTIFIIIGIVLVSLIVGFFLLKEKITQQKIPQEFRPIEDYFLRCIEDNAKYGINLLGEQAGYIYLPEFEPGSRFSPFSNQLDFNGVAVPYWYYVSGNNIAKEQVPTKSEMEKQLETFLEKEFICDFSNYEEKGFKINLSEINADVSIYENKVYVKINADLKIKKDGQSITISNHKKEIPTNLGKLYNLALKIYNKEKQEMFLENYSLDVLYSYEPVYGVNISCSPLIWNPYKIFEDLKYNLENNIASIKIRGNYYKNANKYFVQDLGEPIDVGVNFIYDRNFSSRFEVWPTKNNMMIAEPVGTQEGLGMLGFCYVAYKFVYDMYFPVMVRLYTKEETFQFPIALIISKNHPREALPGENITQKENICDKANTEIEIYTYNTNLEPVEADVEFKCLNDICTLGKTKIENNDAVLRAKVPQCVNGILIVNAEGYKEKQYIISTNTETSADIILDKEYNLSLEIYVDNVPTNNLAVLSINENSKNGRFLTSLAYPYNKNIKLSEGNYKFDLKVYKQNQITLPESTRKECIQIPRKGLSGIFGATDEKCFDIKIPSTTITNVIYAGGKTSRYITESELENAEKIKIYASTIPIPNDIEQLSETYNLIENKNIRIELE